MLLDNFCVFISVKIYRTPAPPYPSQLALTGQESVKPTKVADDLLPGHPNNHFGQCLNSTHHC